MTPYAQSLADWMATPIGWLTAVIATSLSLLVALFFGPTQPQEPQAPEREEPLQPTDEAP